MDKKIHYHLMIFKNVNKLDIGNSIQAIKLLIKSKIKYNLLINKE